MRQAFEFELTQPPESWERLGTIMRRGAPGEYDASVIGDPCIVWDEEAQKYRMFYFAQRHVNGKEENRNACAISKSATEVGPGEWEKLGLVPFTNPELLGTNGHKAFIVLDPYRPHIPARIDGKFWMVQSVYNGYNKTIWLATADQLAGPWTVQEKPIINLGTEEEFDGYNCDSPTAYWFADRNQALIFYKGYPQQPQADQPGSPLGSSPAAAVMSPGDEVATKLGKIISPHPEEGHWTSGWLSTPQIFKAADGGWFGVLNASPTRPVPVEEEPAMREPSPSQGGWIYTPEEWPVSGWVAFAQPMEWIDQFPEEARQNGEGGNMWKHQVLVQPDGTLYLYYHSGYYGEERLFGKRAQVEIRQKEAANMAASSAEPA